MKRKGRLRSACVRRAVEIVHGALFIGVDCGKAVGVDGLACLEIALDPAKRADGEHLRDQG